MFEAHAFCDHCPGCRPAVVDATTGQVMADDSPLMIAINRIWNEDTTYAERKAFIEVTMHNSHTPENMRLAGNVMDKIQNVAKETENSPPQVPAPP